MIHPGDAVFVNFDTKRIYSKPGVGRLAIGQLGFDSIKPIKEGSRIASPNSYKEE